MAFPLKAGRQTTAEIALFSILFLFFLQLLTGLVESTYAFGLLQTGIPYEAACILLLFSPLALLFYNREGPGADKNSRRALLIAGELALLCRTAAVMADTRGKMILSGLGAGLFLVFFPLLLWRYGRRGDNAGVVRLGAGLALGVGLSVLLRAMHSGNDISEFGAYRLIAWGLALIGTALLPAVLRQTDVPELKAPPVARRGSFARVAALSVGLVSVFVLLYFAFSAPGVIARWSGIEYPAVMGILGGWSGLFLLAWLAWPAFRSWLAPIPVVVWNLLFAAALALGLRGYQVAFPGFPGGYPFFEPEAASFARSLLIAALVFHPVLYVDFALLSRALETEAPSIRSLGWGFSLGSLVLLGMILAQVFTTTYDYIPVLGPLMRDRFWLVYAAAGMVLVLAMLIVGEGSYRLPGRLPGVRALPVTVAVLALALAWIPPFVLNAARPAPPPDGAASLRVLTYNIQQGYNANGQKALDEQLEAIRAQDPDVIGLEESDMARIANGDSDVVRYIADRLNLYSYNGPRTVSGTFGIALLSRYPIYSPETFYMYSSGEQTAAIHAQIVAGGRRFNLLVTHLGNDGPIIQQQQVLDEANRLENVILMGDFNFRPDGPQYAETVKRLDDAWLEAAQKSVEPQTLDVDRRIDHVFISNELNVSRALYADPGASDHPLMVIEIPLN